MQTATVDLFRALGYLVQITSRRVKRCSHCHKFPRSNFGDGVTKGVTDLLIGRKEWGAMRCALEMKGTETAVSDQKQSDFRDGLIYITRSIEASLAAVKDFENRNGLNENAAGAQVG